MADQKISDFTTISAFAKDQIIPIVESGLNKSFTISQLDERLKKENVIFVSRTNSTTTSIQDAHDDLPATGGTIYVDSLDAGESDYTSFTVTTDNVHIIGLVPSAINYTSGTLEDTGVRIEGTCLIQASNCSVRSISIHTVNTEADCMRLGNTQKNCIVDNCNFLGKASSSAFHGLLVEGMNNVLITNINTYRNIWGIAIKDSYVNLIGHNGKNHNNGPIIAKADNGSTIRSINISDSVYEGGGFGNYYIQSTLLSTLYDVTMTNCIAYEGGFLYTLVSGSTISGVTYKGCKSRDATNNSWQFIGTSESAIDLIGCSGLGAATNSVYMPDATGHTNIVYSGCDFDNTVQGIRNDSRAAIGSSVSKTSVAENTATDLLKIHFEDFTATAFMVTILSNSTSTQSSSVWIVTSAFSDINATQLDESKFGVATITLTPSINTGTKELTINATIDQTSLTESMTVEAQITPLGGRGQFLVTQL